MLPTWVAGLHRRGVERSAVVGSQSLYLQELVLKPREAQSLRVSKVSKISNP